ncbi:MAG: hypothetical protein J5590_03730 [Clostridia bacterium]|nr:hypothetical protein [Clostridia bacterium]
MGFFDGLFDINGDGKVDFEDDFLNFMIFNECMKEEEEDEFELDLDDDEFDI